jgi:hypothetical protein
LIFYFIFDTKASIFIKCSKKFISYQKLEFALIYFPDHRTNVIYIDWDKDDNFYKTLNFLWFIIKDNFVKMITDFTSQSNKLVLINNFCHSGTCLGFKS